MRTETWDEIESDPMSSGITALVGGEANAHSAAASALAISRRSNTRCCL